MDERTKGTLRSVIIEGRSDQSMGVSWIQSTNCPCSLPISILLILLTTLAEILPWMPNKLSSTLMKRIRRRDCGKMVERSSGKIWCKSLRLTKHRAEGNYDSSVTCDIFLLRWYINNILLKIMRSQKPRRVPRIPRIRREYLSRIYHSKFKKKKDKLANILNICKWTKTKSTLITAYVSVSQSCSLSLSLSRPLLQSFKINVNPCQNVACTISPCRPLHALINRTSDNIGREESSGKYIPIYHSIHYRRRSTMKRPSLISSAKLLFTFLHLPHILFTFISQRYWTLDTISLFSHNFDEIALDRQPFQLMNFTRLRLAIETMLDFMFVNEKDSKIEGFLSNRKAVFSEWFYSEQSIKHLVLS